MFLTNKKTLLFFIIFLSSLNVFSQMSDNEVLRMAAEGYQSGMSQQQIGVMLLEKGATKSQLERLYEQYRNSGSSMPAGGNVLSGSAGLTQDRTRNQSQRSYESSQYEGIRDLYIPEANTPNVNNPNPARNNTVFGRSIFNNNNITFEPQLNIATPENYIFGPGDEIFIDVWGASEVHLRKVISPDGTIIVEGYGPIYLSGLTTKEAESRVKSNLSNIYSGLYSSETHVKLTLGEIRSIKVNVMGEVVAPGTYTLPSLASVFHALYSAGGVNDIGSLRSVKLYRGGKQIVDIDVYGYILEGKNDLNLNLRDGDVVVISPYKNLVEITGNVKRPMIYEMAGDETVEDALNYAGGFRGDAYKDNVRLIRKSGKEMQVFNIHETTYSIFKLNDGDAITVDAILQRYENRVEIRGAVYRPGIYAIDDEVTTLTALVNKADGIRGDAFMNRAILYREREDFTIEAVSVDITALLAGRAADIWLRKNDELYIPSIYDIKEDYTVAINGEVGRPGTYKYVENMSLEDLVIQSGGLLESASTVKIDVARRLKDSEGMDIPESKADILTFTLKDGLIVDGSSSFTLKPFDQVYVRKSPAYKKQENVSIDGEVYYAGVYAIAKRGERLSDLVIRAGGLTKDAYVEGATLHRKLSDDEKVKVAAMMELLKRNAGNKDSIAANTLNIADNYLVGIDLKKALNKIGSSYDVVLKEGDRLVVPEYNGTVKISGAVMYPNTVVYDDNLKLKDYINMAGGQADNAKVSKAYIVYMNGSVAKAKGAKVLPGSEIIVPEKRPGRRMSLPEVLAIATSTTSIAALVTSIVNMTK